MRPPFELGLLLLTAACAAAPSSTGGRSADEDMRAFLAKFTPGSAHEAQPHGVPSSYDWYAESGSPQLTPPNGETVANWWGQVYVDETGNIPTNVRVAVEGVTFLALSAGSVEWSEVQNTPSIGGGSWAEDFHSQCPANAYDARQEVDGSYSFATSPGCNAHYWPATGQAPIRTDALRAVMVVGFTRLVLANEAGPDNRSESTYIHSLGADWRVPGGACPQPAGSSVPICNPIGAGKFIRVAPEWRTLLFSSVSSKDLPLLPLPPAKYFRQPDGTFFR